MRASRHKGVTVRPPRTMEKICSSQSAACRAVVVGSARSSDANGAISELWWRGACLEGVDEGSEAFAPPPRQDFRGSGSGTLYRKRSCRIPPAQWKRPSIPGCLHGHSLVMTGSAVKVGRSMREVLGRGISFLRWREGRYRPHCGHRYGQQVVPKADGGATHRPAIALFSGG
jgi:hypothetical protein